MTTYYIATTGDDATGDGSQGNPYATISKVLTLINGISNREFIIEVTDEGEYSQYNLAWSAGANSRLIVRHTASHLGRPKFNATSHGVNGEFFGFSSAQPQTASFIGIEVECASNGDFFNSSGYINNVQLDISGCFFYGARAFGPGIGRTDPNPSTIRQSTLLFTPPGSGGNVITAGSGLEISNCFISGSGGSRVILFGSDATPANNNVTASFCTIVTRNTNTVAVQRWGKLINCVVSASGPGINANDHTYNLVIGTDGSGDDRYSFVDTVGSPVDAGTGDIKGYPTFVDGDRIGNDPAFIQFYALAEGSLGINQGIEYDGIVVDITGTTRPQGSAPDMGAFELVELPWLDGDGTETYQKKFGSGFEIHGTANKLATRTFASNKDNRQAPYFVTIPGPANLRRRTTPYKNET
jgi:hypothetical protein